jgi:HlyD family secretion protein
MAGKILQIKEIRVSEGDKVEKDDVIFISTDNTKISAKIDGIINKIFVEIDQQVMSGSPLCEIIDFDSLQVSVRVDEYDLETISLGKEIDVYINALNKSVKGKVTEISRTAVSQNGVAFFIAKVSITKDNKIKVGMTAEAKILNQQSKDTIIIPMKALSFDSNNNPFVYLKTDKKTYTKTTVTVGINDGKIVEIKDKLTDGEEIFYKETNKKSNDSRFLPPMPGR